MNRYEVFEEQVGTEIHWGIYDTVTGNVLEWYATKNEAEQNIPEGETV